MDTSHPADKLATWLASYRTYLELLCIGIRAGNDGLSGCSSLAELHRQYRELLPARSRDALDLAVGHRGVIEALCRVRESRDDPWRTGVAVADLRFALSVHDQALARMLAHLASLGVRRTH